MARLKEIQQSDMFSHWVNVDYLPRWGVLLIDLLITLVAFVISYVLGSNLLDYNLEQLVLQSWEQVLILLAIQTVFFWIFHTYSGILRYSTFVDTIKVSLAVIATGVVLIIANIITKNTLQKIPFLNSVLAIYIFVAISLLFGWRVTIKTSFEYLSQQRSNYHRVFIYGTQAAGLSIAKMLQANMESSYRPAGFIIDVEDKSPKSILGLNVYKRDSHLIQIMKEKGITGIIISPMKMKTINPLKDLSIFINNNIRILTTPYFNDYNPEDEDNNIAQRIGKIESINVEDLLERPTIDINTENVRSILTNKVVMITGAAGSIGSEIVRQVAQYQPRVVVLLEIAESPLHDVLIDLRKEFPEQHFAQIIADVRDAHMTQEAFEEYQPDIVFHAAAYKHVPLMEEFPRQAILTNILGTKNVADMAIKYGTKRFVMISTDKAVNPTNVMGASKRIAEIYVQSLYLKLSKNNPDCTKFITTRFGNVLGSNGSVVPYFKKQIAAGGPVTVTHPDIIRFFMTIPEASSLVLEAAALSNGGEIFCFDMGHPVKIADLAKNMIRLAGYEPGRDIEIIYTGLRPGEKLYEELLNQKELTVPTENEKILVAKVREYDFDVVSTEIQALIEEAQHGKTFPCVKGMKKIVPEYKSKNSIYEQLDK
ncbi:MAG: polysaccharide biosynthesis protein [Paludibacteraceae bacterium]|jgi:FlaA1/EpsC-like NDP-sugar epimerase|nr:polysaccharide biosynthesis protein [Paludibacteraceae bacterium]